MASQSELGTESKGLKNCVPHIQKQESGLAEANWLKLRTGAQGKGVQGSIRSASMEVPSRGHNFKLRVGLACRRAQGPSPASHGPLSTIRSYP